MFAVVYLPIPALQARQVSRIPGSRYPPCFYHVPHVQKPGLISSHAMFCSIIAYDRLLKMNGFWHTEFLEEIADESFCIVSGPCREELFKLIDEAKARITGQ